MWQCNKKKVELPGVEPGSGEGIDSAFFMFITRCCRGAKGRVKTSLHPYAANNLQLSSFRLQIFGHFDRLWPVAARTGPRQADVMLNL